MVLFLWEGRFRGGVDKFYTVRGPGGGGPTKVEQEGTEAQQDVSLVVRGKRAIGGEQRVPARLSGCGMRGGAG